MDYTTKSNNELRIMCKERNIRGYGGKNKDDLIALLTSNPVNTITTVMPIIRYIDLFCGLGAFHTAFNSSPEFQCVLACDIDEGARKIYQANYGLEPKGDIRKLDLVTMPDFEILCAGFPCFIAGTKVLTNNGYKPIESVTLNDKLFTHTGLFQRILNLQQKQNAVSLKTIRSKYHPHELQCTDEHPFYVRERTRVWNNSIRRYEYTFGNPKWLSAFKISTNCFTGMPINTKSELPTFDIPVVINASKTDNVSITLDKKDEWFMMGYFLGDGWIQDTKKADGRRFAHTIRFAINNKDEDYVVKRILSVLPITDKLVSTGKCKKFGCSNVVWYTILKQFGKYAHGKIIPEWVQSAPKEYIQEFLDGYKTADGCIQPSSRGIPNYTVSYTTVSENIAYGVQRLYLKLGQLCSIQYFERPKTCVIEGRTCNQRDSYNLRVTISRQRSSSSFIENNYAWFKIDSVDSIQSEPQTVYNFEVENDNSYCVENTIVHNCQPFSIAGNGEGFKDTVKGNLFYDILKIIDAKKPPMCILENVKNLETHDNGNTFNTIKNELMGRGYMITSKVINATEYGSPQARQRIFIVATRDKQFVIPNGSGIVHTVASILDPTVNRNDIDNGKYTLKAKSEKPVVPSKPHVVYDIMSKASGKGGRQGERVYSTDAVGITVCASSGGPGAKTGLYKVGNTIRRLTVKETLGMFGFPSDYKFPGVSSEDCLFYLGNSIVVNVPLAFVPTVRTWFMTE